MEAQSSNFQVKILKIHIYAPKLKKIKQLIKQKIKQLEIKNTLWDGLVL